MSDNEDYIRSIFGERVLVFRQVDRPSGAWMHVDTVARHLRELVDEGTGGKVKDPAPQGEEMPEPMQPMTVIPDESKLRLQAMEFAMKQAPSAGLTIAPQVLAFLKGETVDRFPNTPSEDVQDAIRRNAFRDVADYLSENYSVHLPGAPEIIRDHFLGK